MDFDDNRLAAAQIGDPVAVATTPEGAAVSSEKQLSAPTDVGGIELETPFASDVNPIEDWDSSMFDAVGKPKSFFRWLFGF